MEAEAGGEVVEVLRALRELGEEAHFDGAEESFGGPEGHAGLKDVVRGGWWGMKSRGLRYSLFGGVANYNHAREMVGM